jgi:hypothetical protein
VREEEDEFDEMNEEQEFMPPPFPSHVALPMPAWGAAMVPWIAPADEEEPQELEEGEEDEAEQEELTEEEQEKQWLRGEVATFFCLN